MTAVKLDSVLLWIVDEPGGREEIAARVKEALEAAGLRALIRSPGPADLGA